MCVIYIDIVLYTDNVSLLTYICIYRSKRWARCHLSPLHTDTTNTAANATITAGVTTTPTNPPPY